MFSQAQQAEYARTLTGIYNFNGHTTKIEAWYEETEAGWQAAFRHWGDPQVQKTCQLPERYGNTLERLVELHIKGTLKLSSAEIVFDSTR